jgi:ubiquinone/menaquinone biosynthesis C-methylase UbiE
VGLTEKIVKQVRKPTGRFGMFFARLMNIGHNGVTRWGLSHVSINKNDTILDIGCGGGKAINTLAKMATEGKIYGIDYSEVSVSVATKTNKRFIDAGRVEILHASVESLPFPNDMFDLVTAVESYYFWPDLVNNLRGIRRVLKPGGSLILINECYRDERFERRNSYLARLGDFTYHLPDEFRIFLKKAGYSSIQIEVLENKNWISAKGIKTETK